LFEGAGSAVTAFVPGSEGMPGAEGSLALGTDPFSGVCGAGGALEPQALSKAPNTSEHLTNER